MVDPKKARETAEQKFKQKLARETEGARAAAEYEAMGAATRKKTARLKAQRLAKEAAEAGAAAVAGASPKLKKRDGV